MIKPIFLTGGARTAIGTFCGVFENASAVALGISAAKAALSRSQIPLEQVDEIYFGNILSSGLGPNVARQVGMGAGLSPAVASMTVNKLCGSGMKCIMLAAQGISCGDANVILAGGTENMSRAPYLLDKARTGYRMGNGEILDSLMKDALLDGFSGLHMGIYGDRAAEKYGFSRLQQDDYAVTSFKRAIEAASNGAFAKEIEPVQVKHGREMVTISEDENLKKFNEEKLRKLRPAFRENGTVTAGNASSINDGAAAIMVASEEKVNALGIKPDARILGFSSYSREPEWFTLAPIGALSRLFKMLSITAKDVDLFELNEAFAVVPLAAMKELGIPHEKLNVNGGAIALGHPIGSSGARIVVTLINAMKQRDARVGIASLCIGAGESVAIAVELCH